MALNRHILDPEVQDYINSHLSADVHQLALSKSPFEGVTVAELANQIRAKNKAAKKLPSWYMREGIFYPPVLSIEQTSSETTAKYKSTLAIGTHLLDLTGGFGVDSLYFAKVVDTVTHCEINEELSQIAEHNAGVLEQHNLTFHSGDGLDYLHDHKSNFDTIYVDPARRSTAGKVFMLRDCTPDITIHLDFLLSKARRIIIKTAPLLDITAGLKELSNVSEVHIVSVKNECKELLWLIDRDKSADKPVKIVAVTLNETLKQFSFDKEDAEVPAVLAEADLEKYLYEPDTALLKSGAFNLIANTYQLKKLDPQTQLYTSDNFNSTFPGRIFEIVKLLSPAELKKQKALTGNVIVRSYPDKAELLVKKYKIKPDHEKFLIFTRSHASGNIIIEATIRQHY